MNLKQFVAELAEQGVKLWVEGDRLGVGAAKGVLTPEVRDLLALHKAELVKLLQKKSNASDTSIPQVPVSLRKNLPLSFAQEGLWFLSQLEPTNPFYNEPLALRLQGTLNVLALEKSLNKIIQRHEALRTSFKTVEGQPVQVIAKGLTLSVQVSDLSELPERDREIAWELKAKAQVQQPFDLSSSGLIQASVLKLTPTEHILLLTIHHIIWDAPSEDVLVKELAALYTAYSNDLSLELPELTIQYADFAVWQRQWLQGDVMESQLAYWKQKLEGAPLVLELPTDRVRKATQTFRGAYYRQALSKELTEAMISLSQRQGVTLFMTLLAALQTLLYRYTGQTDICVGTPYAGRDRPEIKGLIGLFVNTLVLRTDISGNPSFEELLSRVREAALGAYAHADLPFEKLVEQLQPARSLSYTPLCQVMLQLYSPLPQIDMEGLTVSRVAVETGTAKFDLSLAFFNTDKGLIGDWEYNTDLFDASTIARMVSHFQTLLEGIVAHPQQKVSELPLLTIQERHQLLVEWNNTTKDYPEDKCIHQLFEEQVELTPDAEAVVFEEEQLTYRELNQRANRIAHYLRTLGVGPEVLVGICVERSLEMIVGLLGILKAGGAYVPLDPTYPLERLVFMLEDASVPVLLTQARLVESLPKHKARVVCLDSDWEKIVQKSESNPTSSVTSNNLAYVIYTSGSTGNPKGVSVPHRAVNRLVLNTNYINLQQKDVVALASNFSFDAVTFEIWGTLLHGARLVGVSKDVVLSPRSFADLIEKQEISVLFLTTALFNQIASVVPSAFHSVQHLLFGGEAVDTRWVKEVLKNGPPQRLLHVYGPTESTTFTTCYDVQDVPQGAKTIPIGRPISNTHCFLLDAQLQPVPIGVPGELYIGGDGLARGYLNRPDLTVEKFIPNPYSNEPGSRLYKTGDLARYLPDGNIEFLGRIDNQVKIRGFRIELGEIEAALTSHFSVEETAVIAREDIPGRKYLAAYIVGDGQSTTSSNLRDFLKQRLPDYMIPSTFVMLSALPLTPNGKIDRRALPKPDTAHQELAAAFVPPRTSVEELLTQIWREVLHKEQVGIHDNFFELGGESILSILIISKANRVGLQLTPKQIFQHQTIAELALVAIPTETLKTEQGLVTGSLPLTPIQHWFFEQSLPSPHHWNQAFLLEVQQELDSTKLQQAVQQLLVHHDALRLRFTLSEEGWQQVNALTDEIVPFSLIDLSTLPPNQLTSALVAKASELQASLNLESGPLLKVALFHLGESIPDRLLMVIHHLAVDGVSWRILLEDLQTAYQQLHSGQPIQLQSKTTSFKHWAQKLTEYAQTDAAKEELTYWQNISSTPINHLPIDCQVGANTEASARTVSVSLNTEETRALLTEVPKAYRTQINDVLLTALVQVLANWSRSTSVLIDLEGHGREEILPDVDLSRTVGWFTTIFPVLLKLDATKNLGETIKSIKEQLRAIPNRGIGYGLLRYLSGDAEITSQLSSLPQAEVSFNYLGQFDWGKPRNSLFKLATESMGSEHNLEGHRRHLLDINGIVVEERLQLDWTYSDSFHSWDTIEGLAHDYIEALKTIITHCLSPETFGYTPSDFPLAKLEPKELDNLLTQLSEISSSNLKEKIEDIYPQSPMQQGMLFHSLYAPEDDVYFVQSIWRMQGNLNVEAFAQAWQQVVKRHPILRTAFMWSSSDKPLQVVYREGKIPLEIHDWRGLSTAERERQLEAFLLSDQKKGFQLSLAPLMRLTLIEVGEEVYQFVWSFHHLLLDGWSVPPVIKEVFTLYEAFCTGSDVKLEPVRHYRDYIAWLLKQDLAKAEVFWRQTLKGFIAPTPLTVDRASTTLLSQQQRYSEQSIQLTEQLTEELKSFARQHQLTLSTLVQGAWAILLSRYSGEADVVFGVTVSGRSAAIKGVESLVGLLINTLPMRVIVSTDDEIIPWMKEIQNQLQQVSQYEYSPLVQIQQWSEVPRGVPLFESLVVFENYPEAAEFGEQNLNLHISDVRSLERTNYPLTVVAVPGTKLSLQLAYDCQRFDDATIARMVAHFQTLLEGIVANPQQKVSSLPLLTIQERHQLLIEWNNTTKEYPQDKCIHQLFEEQVERIPNAVAVVFEGEQLTYRELNQRANTIAHHLRTLGVEPEVLVGICVERSLKMVVGLLGILKAGGAYVPLDPTYPSERLAFMLEDTQISVLLTSSRLVESLPPHSTHIVCLDTQWQEIAFHCEENPISAVTSDNLAYVIYTSGSTGRPKGVAMSHRPLSNLIIWQRENSTLPIGAKTLQFAPVSFDVSFQEIFSTWCSGGTLILISEQVRVDAFELLRFLAAQEINRLFLPFVALQQLAEVADAQGVVVPTLREIITAGEQLQITRPIASWFTSLQNCTLHNHYGPSESHVVTAFTLIGSPSSWPALPPIGRPIANTQIYLLDSQMQQVPEGIPGELYIGGMALARGYLNRPDLTKERFIPDPFSNSFQARLYKTGDKARYLPDGNIEFFGRSDDQVKIRGFRIEPGEIEAAIAQHPAIRETVVIARVDSAGDKQIVAYLVPHQESAPTNSDLRRFLKQQLPEYMVPSAFVVLEALPLTPNGKVDRRALRAPDLPKELEESFVAPRTPIEEMLASIWGNILLIDPVGVHDNFFTLGGHSLLATQVISRVRDTISIELPLRSLFEAPTIAELAEWVENSLHNGQSIQAQPLLPIPRSASIPLSFAQARLWFLDQLQPNSTFYNIPIALRLSGQLNVAAIESSLNEIIRRHEALRTNFTTQEGQPVQVIASTVDWKLHFVDLLHLPKSEREVEAQRLVTAEAQRPFDLEREPLVRAKLLHLDETEYVFMLTIHHIISDGWSVGVLIRELAALYEAFCTGKSKVLPQLPIQYADFAVWQRNWLTGEVFQTQLNYWKQQLSGAPAFLELPTDRSRRAVQSYRGTYQSFALSLELSQALARLSRQAGVTPFMTLYAAFVTLLYRYTGEEDIVVGTPVANRNRQEIEGLIGFFVNTLALRTDLSGNPSFEELLYRVREVALQAYTHQDLPFEQLVEALQPERSLSHTPLFQVMFVLQNAPMPSMALPNLTISSYSLEIGTAKFDLTLSMENTADGLVGVWEYNSDLFDEVTIARLAGHFQTLLEGIVTNPNQTISELPLLTQAERHQLLFEWNNTTTEYPQDKCIHQLFEEQVERTPNAVAVVFEGEQLTYRELNARANQLAHYLRALGVGSEVLVGICSERSVEMVIGLLGILKVGGAYVPLDPTYPSERLRYMLEDSSVPVLLVQKHLVEKLPQHSVRVVYLDFNQVEISQQSKENVTNEVTPENLANVMYTSGSTGLPKGVSIIHRGVVRLVKETNYANLSTEEVFLQLAPISFDASTFEIWGSLLNGARLVVMPPHTPSLQELGQALRQYQVTTLWLTAGLFHLMVDERLEDLKNVRQLLAGGDVLSVPHVKKLFQQLKECILINGYGPTENTTFTCCYGVTDPSQIGNSVPIGRSIANTQVYLLDKKLQPVPIGVPGEVYIGGDGLARGYLNRPDLTEEKFIPNPFSNEPGLSLYKTGDKARYLPDGNIEYLGRLDNQVKIRGFRIELGEIEAALAQHQAVREAVVIAREDIPGNKRLVAYLVTHIGEQNLSTPDWRAFLKQKLPEYMVPSVFIMLDALPLTPNGKVDRRALPIPQGERPDLETSYTQPQTQLEEAIAQIWQQILQVEKVGIHDNFFELGGNSLLLVRVHSQLSEVLHQHFSIVELFQYPTIQTLANHLSQKQSPQTPPEKSHQKSQSRTNLRAGIQQLRQRQQKNH